MKNRVLLFYKYTYIGDAKALMDRERSVCEVLNLKGRIIIAEEGINGTLEGTYEETQKYIEHIKKDKRFKLMDIKESEGTGEAFPKLSVKVKSEIVSTKLPSHINPNKKTGVHLQPDELHRWYRSGADDFVVVDMRNDYELQLGHFEKTVDPGLVASRDLMNQEVLNKLRLHKDKKIVTTCTGGVRCEKMSAYLLDQGFENVYQLHNGMHGYMEKFPGKDFNGTLYTFDGRKTMHFGGDRKVIGKCYKCEAESEELYDVYKDDGHEYQLIVCDECVTCLGENARRGNVYKNAAV